MSPLHKPDLPFDDAPADLPLREDIPLAPEGPGSAGREIFAAMSAAPVHEPAPSRRLGLLIWLIAAGSLVTGIIIGFGTGYDAGRRAAGATLFSPDRVPAAATRGEDPQTFTEGSVGPATSRTASTPTPGPVHIVDTPIASAARPVGEAADADEPLPEILRVDSPGIETPVIDRSPSEPPAAAPRAAPPAASPPEVAASNSAPRPPAPQPVSPAPEPPRAAVPPAAGPGSLEIVSRPAGAQVVLDGRVVGRTPMVLNGVSPGSHSIRLDLPGFRRWATTIDVTSGNQTRVAASLEQ